MIFGQEGCRLNLRIHRLRKILSKSQPEDERTQVVNGSDAAHIMGKRCFGIEFYIFSALLGGL